jgi:hypothetical protein
VILHRDMRSANEPPRSGNAPPLTMLHLGAGNGGELLRVVVWKEAADRRAAT